jgi:hypothetical protein
MLTRFSRGFPEAVRVQLVALDFGWKSLWKFHKTVVNGLEKADGRISGPPWKAFLPADNVNGFFGSTLTASISFPSLLFC